MKKLLILFALLMVGMAADSQAIERYYTSNSTAVTIATPTITLTNGATLQQDIPYAITAIYLENGLNDGACLIVIDSNTQTRINNGATFANPFDYPRSQWLAPPLYAVTSTGTQVGPLGRVDFPNGLFAKDGFTIHVASRSGALPDRNWTLELTPAAELKARGRR